MDALLQPALTAGAAVVLATAGALLLRRPRLTLDVALRGGTRNGTLYVTAGNRGGRAARRVRVEIEWSAPDGRTIRVATQALEDLQAREPRRVEVDRLHAAIDGQPAGWDALVVTLRAANAFPARRRLALDAVAPKAAGTSPPVRYLRDLPCPAAADGAHAFELRAILNDGVTEQWDVCRRCRHVQRRPLSPGEQAVQARIRAERAQRERRAMEAEFDRLAREEDPPPRRARRETPAEEDAAYPPALAFFVLELDADATWPEVVAAHRRLAFEHHPDRRPDADAATRAALERKMQEINDARDRLRAHLGAKPPLE